MKKKEFILQTKGGKRCIAWGVACALIVSLFSCMGPLRQETAQAAVTLHNPIYDSGVREVEPGTVDVTGNIHNPVYDADTDTAEWDCVWFGNYWQNDTNGDGVVDQNDEKEPIKWRVLSVDGDDVFLLADKTLDRKPYNEECMDVTWETCTLRSWLNGYDGGKNACNIDFTSDNFLDTAFSEEEQAAIRTTDVVNADNPEYGTEGGNDTTDKVYLLSSIEATNTAYGFCNTFYGSDTRISECMAYSDRAGYIDMWWLRSPGDDRCDAMRVGSMGNCTSSNYKSPIDDALGVRPVLHLTLSFLEHLSYGGTVTSTYGGKATWDCVYFGNYWQNDTNRDGMADKNDEKEPIKWRVLSVNDDDVFLLSDKNLDARPYNAEPYKADKNGYIAPPSAVTWETCTLRSWLNGYDGSKNDLGIDYTSDNFIDEAFFSDEQAAIKDATVVNDNNPYYKYGAEGGNTTTDKVYLLSIAEVSKTSYGFYRKYDTYSFTREALNTEYMGNYRNNTNCAWGASGESDIWWLRSPGGLSGYAVQVQFGGLGIVEGAWVNSGMGYYDDVMGDYEEECFDAVRPCLHLNLSDTTLWSYAGTVCSDGTVTDADGNVVPTPVPTKTPEESPSPTPENTSTVEPTAKPTTKPTIVPTTAPVSPTKSPAGNGTASTPAPGQIVKDISTKAFYQIISTGTANAEVSFIRQETRTKKAKVPAVIYHGGKKYKVTSVAAKAFAGNKKLKSVVIGKNVRKIQKKAFANCKKLSKVTVKSKILSKVAKNAFQGTKGKLTVKVPKKKRMKYRRLFRGKGNKKLKVK